MKKSKKRTAQQRFAANPEIARIIKNLTAITERMDKKQNALKVWSDNLPLKGD